MTTRTPHSIENAQRRLIPEPAGGAQSLVVPVPPSANRYWRRFRGVVCPSAEAKAFKKRVREIGEEAGVRPLEGRVAVEMHVHRGRRSGDLDNRIKPVLDSVQGLLFANDSQVAEIHAYLHDDPRAPRVEISVRCV